MEHSHEAPSSRADCRQAVFRQHKQLAVLLDEVEKAANDVLGDPELRDALHRHIGELHGRFVKHLAYEETHVVPWLRASGAAELVEQAAAMLVEHKEQRARADGLLHDRAVFSDPRTLAREALVFVRTIREDMKTEDHALRDVEC